MKSGNIKYQAAAANNVVIATGKALLLGIIIGADVANAVVQVADSASSGSSDVQIKLSGSSLMTATGGYVAVGAVFHKGITANITNQTDVTFVWAPLS